jgi:hypothetical protein
MSENFHILMRLSAREDFIDSSGSESFQDYKCWKFVTSGCESTHTHSFLVKNTVAGDGQSEWAAFPVPPKTCLLPTTAGAPKVVINTTYWGRTPLTEASFLIWWTNSPIIVSFKETILSSSFVKQFSVSTLPAEQNLTSTRGLALDDECKSFIDDTTSLPYFQNLQKECVAADNVASFANSPSSKALSLSHF